MNEISYFGKVEYTPEAAGFAELALTLPCRLYSE